MVKHYWAGSLSECPPLACLHLQTVDMHRFHLWMAMEDLVGILRSQRVQLVHSDPVSAQVEGRMGLTLMITGNVDVHVSWENSSIVKCLLCKHG